MMLEKEIIDELIKRGWEQLKDRTYDKTALLETTIQLTQDKIIQIIDKRIEELEKLKKECLNAKRIDSQLIYGIMKRIEELKSLLGEK